MSFLQVGVIGCGRIAREVHLPILQKLSSVRVVALAELDEVALQKAHQLSPHAVCFSNAGDLLDHSQVEAVVIALPNHLHASTATQAFACGKHVYLEKPLGLTPDEGQKVVEAWQSAGTVGALGFNYRFNPLLLQTKNLLNRKAIGPLITIRSSFCAPLGQEPAWKANRASGGGVLLDLASHHLDLIRFLTEQNIVEVQAEVRSMQQEMDTATIELRLEDQTLVQGLYSQRATERDTWEFDGLKGRLRVDRYNMSSVEMTRPGELGIAARLRRAAREVGPVGATRSMRHTLKKLREPNNEPSYRVAIGQFVRAAQGNPAKWLATPLDGLHNIELIAALEKSAHTGSRVKL